MLQWKRFWHDGQRWGLETRRPAPLTQSRHLRGAKAKIYVIVRIWNTLNPWSPYWKHPYHVLIRIWICVRTHKNLYLYEFIYVFIYVNMNSCLNFCTWIHSIPFWYSNSYVLSTKSHMNSWFSMNLYLNSVYEFTCKTLPGTTALMGFHELMPDTMGFGFFSWERSYSNSCLKSTVKNIVKKYSAFMEFFSLILNWIHWRSSLTRCIWQASLSCSWCSRAICPQSAGLFGRATVPIPATLDLSHTQFWLPELRLHQLEFHSDIEILPLQAQCRAVQAASDHFKFSPVT